MMSCVPTSSTVETSSTSPPAFVARPPFRLSRGSFAARMTCIRAGCIASSCRAVGCSSLRGAPVRDREHHAGTKEREKDGVLSGLADHRSLDFVRSSERTTVSQGCVHVLSDELGCGTGRHVGGVALVMETSLVLGAYSASLFSAAVMLPTRTVVLRMIAGYASLILLGVVVSGLAFPELPRFVLDILNDGVKTVWNLTEE